MAKLYITSDSVWRERVLPAWTASLLAWEGAALEVAGAGPLRPPGVRRAGEESEGQMEGSES